MRSSKLIGIFAWLGVAALAFGQNAGSFGPLLTPSTIGIDKWDENCVGIHAALFDNGKLIIWGYRGVSTNPPAYFTRAYIVNAYTRQFEESIVVPDVHIFCAGHSHDASGKLVIAGGTEGGTRDHGIARAYIYDPYTKTFTRQDDMVEARYYPTTFTLADGRVGALSGWRVPEAWSTKIEVFNSQLGTWASFAATPSTTVPWYYPFTHTFYDPAAPAGSFNAFIAGQFMQVPNSGGSQRESYVLSITGPTSGEWIRFGGTFGQLGITSVMMIRSTDPVDRGVVYKFGGLDVQNQNFATNQALKFDFEAADPGWESAGTMHHPRTDCTAVLLPDGTVAIVGGSSRVGHPYQQREWRVPNVEIFNPATDTFALSPDWGDESRMYHSLGILLPDRAVLICGGQYRLPFIDDTFSEISGRLYYPPYYNSLGRPTIVGTATPTMHYYGVTPEEFTFNVLPGEGNTVDQVTMIRLGAVTHASDMSQRYINLTIKSRTDSTVTVRPPLNGHIAPPGKYMLFALINGVPSDAHFVTLQ
ncbi:MAG: galactose oxidase early set domain-containing protein [Armatimonadota bacterium]